MCDCDTELYIHVHIIDVYPLILIPDWSESGAAASRFA